MVDSERVDNALVHANAIDGLVIDSERVDGALVNTNTVDNVVIDG